AVAGDNFKHLYTYTENDWPDLKDQQAYTKSKIMAEKVAWDFMKENNPKFVLTTINPGYVMGPLLHNVPCTSIEVVKKLLMRETPILADIFMPACDVRNVAQAHINAMMNPEADSQRHIIVSTVENTSMKDWALILDQEFSSKGYNVPTKVAPNFMVKFMSLFDAQINSMKKMLGIKSSFSNSRMINVLKVEPIALKIPTIYWKCKLHKNCNDRAISSGLNPPLNHSRKHNHIRDKERSEEFVCVEIVKNKALNTNNPPRAIRIEIQKVMSFTALCSVSKPDAIRQMILRARTKKFSFKKNEEFYWGDSGSDDKNRVIVFTTEKNLSLLNDYCDWYADGTFDMFPTFFKQIYILHLIINGTLIPCVYAMLPNKKQTANKMFKMVRSFITNDPKSVNMDFEKAAMNSAQMIFGCKIYGCFFHLSQLIFRGVQNKGYVAEYALNDKFRHSFKLI
ncbi:NADPH-dependent aldehyde reductase ARI1-like isoform X1, partial [Brachionus plicatilis]